MHCPNVLFCPLFWFSAGVLTISLRRHQIQERREHAGQVIKACFLSRQRREAFEQATKAAKTISVCMRRYHMRQKMKTLCKGLEIEAKCLSDTHMHEMDKVLAMDEYFAEAGNKSLERLRLAKCILKHRKEVRHLFMAFSTLGVSDVKKAFRISKIQWINFCIEAKVAKTVPEKAKVFNDIFTHCNQGTEPFLPPYQSSEDSFLVMCEWVEALVRLGSIAYPSRHRLLSLFLSNSVCCLILCLWILQSRLGLRLVHRADGVESIWNSHATRAQSGGGEG